MIHIFSDLEGIRIAVEMEKRGESFYRRAAKVSHCAETVEMLKSLANDEQMHRMEFERLYKREAERGLSNTAYEDETNAYLTAIAAELVFPKGLMGLSEEGFDSPPAVLRAAIASEKDSILFYNELHDITQDAHAKQIFKEIARQEHAHLFRLNRQLGQLL